MNYYAYYTTYVIMLAYYVELKPLVSWALSKPVQNDPYGNFKRNYNFRQ